MAGGLDSGGRIALLALAWLGGIALQLQQATLSAAASYLVLLALGLALVVRIREAYDSIEEDEILALDAARGSSEPRP